VPGGDCGSYWERRSLSGLVHLFLSSLTIRKDKGRGQRPLFAGWSFWFKLGLHYIFTQIVYLKRFSLLPYKLF